MLLLIKLNAVITALKLWIDEQDSVFCCPSRDCTQCGEIGTASPLLIHAGGFGKYSNIVAI